METVPSDFDRAVAFTLRHEGGYVNDPGDPGGETNFGISKRSFPDLDIANLTREEAVEIYRVHYWDRHRCGERPWPECLVLFDSAVNCGQRAAGWGGTWPEMLYARLAYHHAISARKSLRGFLRGWLARCLDLWTICQKDTQ